MNMSTSLQEEINALEAELREYAALPLADRAQWKEVIAAKENRLTELLKAQAAASSSAAATEARGKHLSPSL